MKKTIVVVAVVTGYCLLQVSVALLTVSHAPDFYPSTLAQRLMLGQFVLIPGMAVIFSRFVHGRRGWVKRALVIFAAGVFGGPLLPFLIGTPLVLLSEFSVPVGAVLSLVVLSLVVWAVRWIRRSGRRSVEWEANRWLAERQCGVTRNELKRHRQVVGWSLWIPSVTVLLVFLFFPELWGAASHLVHPRMGDVSEYRFSLPFSWIFQYRESDYRENVPTGESSIIGLAGTGLGRSSSKHLRRGFLSGWHLWTDACSGPENTDWETYKNQRVLAKRRIGTGAKELTCVESWPFDWGGPTYDEINVYCAGPPRLHATLCCDRKQTAVFYKMLGTLDYSGNAPPCPVRWTK